MGGGSADNVSGENKEINSLAYTVEDSIVDSKNEGKPDAYWGHIPENKTFAFVDSRYYDGTDYVKVFNVGFYMQNKGEYYTNGDWTDLNTVYRREDYYKNEEFKEFSENGKVSDEKPEGYPTNDVGGDADGKLPSYNAGIYDILDWENFSMFGRYWYNNYGIDSVISAKNISTYVEIWRVAPELKLEVDKENISRGEEFTATLSIENHFDCYDGLPTIEQISFTSENAEIIPNTEIVKEDNKYIAKFRATNDLTVDEIKITASVGENATNYKPKTTFLSLQLPKESYTVTYTDGVENEEIFADQKTENLSYGMDTPEFIGSPNRQGYKFIGWSPEVSKTVTETVTYTAMWEKKSNVGGYELEEKHAEKEEEADEKEKPELNRDDHLAYVMGYPDGNVKPENNITREEVAAIFFRLLSDDSRDKYWSDVNSFSDMSLNRWSNIEISTLVNAGIISGYPDGTFRPSENITRAEFATIAAQFDNSSTGEKSGLYDINGHWGEKYIDSAFELGWVSGYPDNTFKPDKYISRAEAMTLINNVLNRHVRSEEDLVYNMKEWPDNMDRTEWYYYPVQEATNSHIYERKEDGVNEKWNSIIPNRNWNIIKYNRF